MLLLQTKEEGASIEAPSSFIPPGDSRLFELYLAVFWLFRSVLASPTLGAWVAAGSALK
jgi:hypothetical protein